MTLQELAGLTDEQLEIRLLELAMDDDIGGHRAQAQASAIRTVLRRRRERIGEDDLALRERAAAIVNDRHPDDPVTADEIHPVDAQSIVYSSPIWCDLFVRRRQNAAGRDAA